MELPNIERYIKEKGYQLSISFAGSNRFEIKIKGNNEKIGWYDTSIPAGLKELNYLIRPFNEEKKVQEKKLGLDNRGKV